MQVRSAHLRDVLARLRAIREERGLTRAQLEESLILGPGWIECFEEARVLPTLDVLVALLGALQADLCALSQGVSSTPRDEPMTRYIYAEPRGADLAIRFRYAQHDATYLLPDATEQQFNEVLRTLRDGLARQVAARREAEEQLKRGAVANAFLHAVRVWPHANPSDLWYFVVHRAYCDPFNHPAAYSRLNLEQSWKRTGGWALEEVLIRHYAGPLAKHGIRLFVAPTEEKRRLLAATPVSDRLEPDKADVLLSARGKGEEMFFGVVHVKASFAERRTDDVPMSRALIENGYLSPLWTMDCKAGPAAHPANKGELGRILIRGERDRRSAKRKDVEEDGYFSACFSYNRNTLATPQGQDVKARVLVCDFNRPQDDAFVRFILAGWKAFQRTRRGSS